MQSGIRTLLEGCIKCSSVRESHELVCGIGEQEAHLGMVHGTQDHESAYSFLPETTLCHLSPLSKPSPCLNITFFPSVENVLKYVYHLRRKVDSGFIPSQFPFCFSILGGLPCSCFFTSLPNSHLSIPLKELQCRWPATACVLSVQECCFVLFYFCCPRRYASYSKQQ